MDFIWAVAWHAANTVADQMDTNDEDGEEEEEGDDEDEDGEDDEDEDEADEQESGLIKFNRLPALITFNYHKINECCVEMMKNNLPGLSTGDRAIGKDVSHGWMISRGRNLLGMTIQGPPTM